VLTTVIINTFIIFVCIFTRIVEILLLQSRELVDMKDNKETTPIQLAMNGPHWNVIEVNIYCKLFLLDK
jgi:hypothetical protein